MLTLCSYSDSGDSEPEDLTTTATAAITMTTTTNSPLRHHNHQRLETNQTLLAKVTKSLLLFGILVFPSRIFCCFVWMLQYFPRNIYSISGGLGVGVGGTSSHASRA